MKSAREIFNTPQFFTPAINVGGLFDLQNCRIQDGSRGERIVNGGLTYMTGIAGRQNSYKSTIARFFALTAFSRMIPECRYTFYDTEGHAEIERDMQIAKHIEGIDDFDFYNDPRYLFTKMTAEPGEKFYSKLIDMLKDKTTKENVKEHTFTCPMLNPAKSTPENYKMLAPDIIVMDTASRFSTTANSDLVAKNEIGDGKLNAGNFRSGNDRNWLFSTINTYLLKDGGYLVSPAHVGQEFQIDQYAPSSKQLRDLKNGYKLKGVPESYTTLTTDLWYVLNSKPLINDTTKAPQYPRDSDENELKDSPDLFELVIVNLRGKNGMSGFPFKILASQEQGVLPNLSEYHFLRGDNGYGMNGSINGHHSLVLCPDIKLQRTTARGKIDESYALRRALQITSEIRQIDKYWLEYNRDIWCPPDVLFEDLKKMGYDWDELLGNTRGWWCPLELEKYHPTHYLSFEDLFRIRKGLYKPYWMQ